MKNLFRNTFLYVFVFSTLFAHAQQPVYKNKEMPIDLRVDNLLSIMTIDEKIAQIRHLHSYQIYDGQELNIEKLQKMVGNQDWGFVEGVIRDVQATLIPSLMIYEKSTGKNIGTTNNRGEFKINVGNKEVLILRKDGYKTTEVAVDNQRKINIRMESGDDDDDE